MKKLTPLLVAIAYALIFIAIQAIAQTIVLGFEIIANGKEAAQLEGLAIIVYLVLFSLTSIALFTWQRWSPVGKGYVLSRPWGVLGWSVVAAMGAIVPSLYLQELLPPLSGWLEETARQSEQLFQQIIHIHGGYFVLAILAPVAEELVFRGAVLRQLLEWQPERRWAMIALSAFVFALCHLNPAQMPHAFLIGLLLGWLYMRTRSVLPGMVFHWVNNSVAYFLMTIYPDPSIHLTDIFGGRTLLAVGFSLLIFLPALYQLNQRMKTVSK